MKGNCFQKLKKWCFKNLPKAQFKDLHRSGYKSLQDVLKLQSLSRWDNRDAARTPTCSHRSTAHAAELFN